MQTAVRSSFLYVHCISRRCESLSFLKAWICLAWPYVLFRKADAPVEALRVLTWLAMVHVARRIYTWVFRYNAVYDSRSGADIGRQEGETEKVIEGRSLFGSRSELSGGAVKLFEHCWYCWVWQRPEIQRILLPQLVLSLIVAGRRSHPGPSTCIDKKCHFTLPKQ